MRPLDPNTFEKLEAASAARRARAISTIGLTVLPPVLLVLVVVAVLASRLQPGPAHSGANGARSGSVATATPTATAIPTTPAPFTPPTPAPPPFPFAAEWQNDPAAPSGVASVVFSPSAPQFGYLCVASIPGPGGALAQSAAPPAAPAHPASGLPALFTTTHGGLAWSPLTGVPFGQPTNCRLTLDPNDPRSLYAVVDTPPNASSGGTVGTSTLWHTPDGGQTWQEPSVPPVPGFSSVIGNLIVSGPRVVALVSGFSQTANQPPTLLDASDDGGHTWKNITPTLTLDGQRVSISGILLSMGSTLIVGGVVASAAPIGASLPIGAGAASPDPARLAPPLGAGPPPTVTSTSPGGPPSDTHYFASIDGGATWAPMALPAHLSPNLTFTPSADGSTFYGAVTANQQTADGRLVTVPYLTRDAGRTWAPLPTLEGAANGYLDVYEQGALLAVSPTGAVLIQTIHTSDTGAAPSGIFFLSNPTATWQAFAYDPNVFNWQVASAPGDGRLWGIRIHLDAPPGGDLVYVDLP